MLSKMKPKDVAAIKETFITYSTPIEKIGDVIPQPKVYMKNAIEIGKITLLKLTMCRNSPNSLNI